MADFTPHPPCGTGEKLAALDASVSHLQKDVTRLGEELRETKQEFREDIKELREENRRGLDDLKAHIETSISNMGERIEKRIEAVEGFYNECSRVNGTRLRDLEDDLSHSKGVSRGAVAVITLLSTALGGLVVALARVFIQ